MAWHYDPPAPETEAEVTLSAYHLRQRAAESRDLVEVNAETAPADVSRSNRGRLRNAVIAIFTKVARVRSKTDRNSAP